MAVTMAVTATTLFPCELWAWWVPDLLGCLFLVCRTGLSPAVRGRPGAPLCSRRGSCLADPRSPGQGRPGPGRGSLAEGPLPRALQPAVRGLRVHQLGHLCCGGPLPPLRPRLLRGCQESQDKWPGCPASVDTAPCLWLGLRPPQCPLRLKQYPNLRWPQSPDPPWDRSCQSPVSPVSPPGASWHSCLTSVPGRPSEGPTLSSEPSGRTRTPPATPPPFQLGDGLPGEPPPPLIGPSSPHQARRQGRPC